MKKLAIILTILAATPGVRAVDVVTATVTVTNAAGTTNGQVIGVNTLVRTWTNSVVAPGQEILTNATPAGALTNMFGQFSGYPFANLSMSYSSSTSLALRSFPGVSLVVTQSVGWGTVAYSTNTLTAAVAVRIPYSVEGNAQQTNIASGLVNWLNLATTNQLSATATAMAQLAAKTNGVVWTPVLVSPVLTNGVNYGDPFRSPGGGTSSEQFGTFASAPSNYSLAIGNTATSSWAAATAIGAYTLATKQSSTAVGTSAHATGTESSAIGTGAVASDYRAHAFGSSSQATGTNSTAIGATAWAALENSIALGGFAQYSNSISIGWNASSVHPGSMAVGHDTLTTKTNQILLGLSGDEVFVPGALRVAGGSLFSGAVTNLVTSGTNNFPSGSDIAFGRYSLTSLATGNNAAVPVGTNVFVEVTSGPAGAFAVVGIAGGRDGKFLILYNATAQDMTISHQSGVDATAANRIITMTGADRTTTAAGAATLIYSASASRWILIGFDP